RGRGQNTVPPLRHRGFRISPTRARPVPFCRQGFFPLPCTSARVFVLWVPERRLARYCLTAWCISPTLIGPANTASARSSWPTTSLFRFLISTLAIITALISPPQHIRRPGRVRRRERIGGCYLDRRERREGSARSRVHFPNVPPSAFLSERVTDKPMSR